MLGVFWMLFWTFLAVLAVAAGVTLHMRRRELLASSLAKVDDDAIATILERGELYLEEDEPLDQQEIDEEEERFWSESWDEPEEW